MSPSSTGNKCEEETNTRTHTHTHRRCRLAANAYNNTNYCCAPHELLCPSQNIRAMEREGDTDGEGHPLLEAVQSCIAAAAGEFDVARQQVKSEKPARLSLSQRAD